MLRLCVITCLTCWSSTSQLSSVRAALHKNRVGKRVKYVRACCQVHASYETCITAVRRARAAAAAQGIPLTLVTLTGEAC